MPPRATIPSALVLAFGLAATAVAVPPVESDVLTQARHLLGNDFRLHESTHFVVLSDADETMVKTQAQVLERSLIQFDRFSRRLDIRPGPLRHKLVSILFLDRDAFLAFARAFDGLDSTWISGYYSPQHDWTVFYDPTQSPNLAAARSALSRVHDAIRRTEHEAGAARRRGRRAVAADLGIELTELRSTALAQQRIVDDYADEVRDATTVHESIHQLLFHTGVQSDRVRYPLWISEGLATAFETDDPSRPFGPDSTYAPRRDRFESLLAAGDLEDLSTLVERISLDDVDSDAVDRFYHQSCSLVTWLATRRRDDLAEYLRYMVQQEGEGEDAAFHRRAFRRCFGDERRLEITWLRDERSGR